MSARNTLRQWLAALKLGEKLDLASGDAVKILPKTDDTGKVQIGDGTTDMDFQVYLGASTSSVLFDVGNAAVTLTSDVSIGGAGSTVVPLIPTAAQQALSGAGAVNITTFYTAVTNTGSDALTLADGAQIGQLKKVQMIVDPGTNSVLTPANFVNGTTITFADVGDYALLVWTAAGWVAIELGNDADGVTAPAVA